MKILDLIYNHLLKRRDEKQKEIIRLRWEKANLEKQLSRLKENKGQRDD